MDLNFSEFRRGQGWFILPAAFEDMFSRLHAESKGNGIATIAARFEQKSESDFYERDDGVAIIPISGPIMKRASFLSFFFGGTSYPAIRRSIYEALEDDEVDSIVLKIDSPGGVVNGVEETGDLIFNSRGEKPIVAYADGMMTSAAYWIASAADGIYTGKTADIGSIGVLMVHEDWSRWNEKNGINVTYLTAGKYKAIGNPDEPLTDLARETFQAELDYLYSIFINTVARNRDEEESKVLTDMADGRIFIGQQAVDAGLADDVKNFNAAVDIARDMAGDGANRRVFQMGDKDTKIMTIDDLRAEHGELINRIEADARQGVDIETSVNEAREKECSRVLGMVDIQFGADQGAKFRAVVETGVSVDQFKAIKGTVVEPESSQPSEELTEVEQARANLQAAIEAAGPENPGFDANSKAQEGQGYLELVAVYQRENKCTKFEAMQAVNRQNPELRKSYLKKVNG